MIRGQSVVGLAIPALSLAHGHYPLAYCLSTPAAATRGCAMPALRQWIAEESRAPAALARQYVCSSSARFRIASPISRGELASTVRNRSTISPALRATRISQPGSKNVSIPSQSSVITQAASAGRFKHPGRRRETNAWPLIRDSDSAPFAPNSSRRCDRWFQHGRASAHSAAIASRPILRRPEQN